jgi:hypothetical protein
LTRLNMAGSVPMVETGILLPKEDELYRFGGAQ